MTNRRSFFKRLGLAATSIAVTRKLEAAPTPPPPVPNVKSKRAHIALVAGHEPKVINHQLGSMLICAMAGSTDGKVRPAIVEAINLNTCEVRVPKPQRGAFSFFSWLARKTPSPVYSLVVYVPA